MEQPALQQAAPQTPKPEDTDKYIIWGQKCMAWTGFGEGEHAV